MEGEATRRADIPPPRPRQGGARARAMSLLSAGAVAGFSALASIVPAVIAPRIAEATYTAPSAVTDVNPNALTSGTLFGGRTVAFAVNPINTQIVFAATEFGGLWKSANHGASWSHVDQVPLTAMQDVQFAASDANLVIATGSYDGSSDNRGGGVWRSTDGGTTWAKANADFCATMSSNNANHIAIAPGSPGSLTIFVAEQCALAKSTDSGATWSIDSTPVGGRFWDVKVRQVSGNLQVDTCGDNGFLRSNDGGATWPTQSALPNVGGNQSFLPCRITTAPQDPNTVFMTDRSPVKNPGDKIGETYQFENDNGGASGSWHNLNVSTDGNGRAPSVLAFPAYDGLANHFEVYFLTDQIILHQTCDTNNPQRCADGSGANTSAPCCSGSDSGPWKVYDASIEAVHYATDPGDLVLDPTSGCPFLEGGDGGIFQTADGCDSSPTFTDANAGLHALWLYQTAATAVPGGSGCCPGAHTSVYYGMQDNGQYCSNNDATSWYGCGGADVGNTLADRSGPPSDVLMASDGGFSLHNEDFSGSSTWNNPPGANLDGVDQFGYESYAFITDDGATTPTYSVYVTTDGSGTWTQMGQSLPGAPAGPGIVASGTPTTPVFYLELTVNNAPTIYRLSGPMTSSATLAKANNGLNTPGTFNVDPSNPLRLYAVDTGLGEAMSSSDGGESWTPDSGLTNIVTQGGVYPFQTNAGPDISSFGFDPNSSTVLAGTNFSGTYASPDGGAHWVFVRGSKQISRTGEFAFDGRNPGTVYAGSVGRGLWRITLPSADLSIAMTHSPDPVVAGSTVIYTVTLTNHGPDAAGLISVRDDLPPQLVYEASNNGCTENPTGSGHLTCNEPDLASGSSESFTIKALVRSDAAVQSGGPTSFDNTASVQSGDSFDPASGNNSTTDTTYVNESADLQVSKICDSSVQAGQTATCTVYVDNHGPSDARNVSMTDQETSTGSFTVQSVSSSQGTCTGAGGPASSATISCSLGNLAAASTTQTGRATVTIHMTAADGQTISDHASASSDTPDPDGTNNTANSSVTITAVADMAITGMSAPGTVTAGTGMIYNVDVSNGGPSTAQNVVISDNLPAGVTISSVNGNGGATCKAGVPGDSTQPTTCNFGNVASGSTRNMSIVVNVNPQTTGTLHDDAKVSSDTFDPDLSNNLGHTDTTVATSADLVTSIAATPNPVTAGRQLSYQVTVTDNGPSTAVGVSLTDTLPGVLAFTSATTSAAGGSCGFQVNTNTVQCQLGTLDPGTSAVVTIYTTVSSAAPNGSTIVDAATASSSTADPAPANNTASVSTGVVTSADLGVALGSDQATYKPSTVIHYNVSATNAGPSDAQAVVVTIQLPPTKYGFYVSDNGGCSLSGTVLTCPLGTMVAGGSRAFQVNWQVQGNKGTLTATATISSSTSDPNSANNTSTRNVTVK